MKIIGADPNHQDLVDQRMTDVLVKRSIVLGEPQDSVRIDPKYGYRIWVLSTPIKHNREVIGAVYLVAKIENVFEQMKDINKIFVTGTAIALAITAVLGVLLARTITRPIADMRRQALAMAKGNFSRKVKVYGYDEIGQLAITFNNLTKTSGSAGNDGRRTKKVIIGSLLYDGWCYCNRPAGQGYFN